MRVIGNAGRYDDGPLIVFILNNKLNVGVKKKRMKRIYLYKDMEKKNHETILRISFCVPQGFVKSFGRRCWRSFV